MAGFVWIGLIYLCAKLIDGTSSAEDWKIESLTPKKLNDTTQRNITINCKVKYPFPKHGGSNIKAFWKAFNKGSLNIASNDKNAFIWHPNESFVITSFQGRTKLTGNIYKNDCSLFIGNLRPNDFGKYYLRVETGSNNYSFKETPFIIEGVLPVTESSQGNEETTSSYITTSFVNPPSLEYVAIFVPVVLILLTAIILAALVFLFGRRKRESKPKRENSSYYVNFQRPSKTSSNDCELTDKHHEEKKSPLTSKVEPIYSNVQGKCTPDLNINCDQTDNIYCNVGHVTQI